MDLATCKTGETETEPKETKACHESDLPPEYCRYRDEGCEYATSCLDCPFERCLYDEPRGRQRWLKGLRDKEINRLFNRGRGMQELALMFGVSVRTVQRALKAAAPSPPDTANKA